MEVQIFFLFLFDVILCHVYRDKGIKSPASREGMDIGLVPSTYPEPFPLVPLEMMAAGLPVITSDIGGFVEMIEQRKTGIMAPVGDAAALAREIESLLDNPQSALEMGRAARRSVEERFTWDRHVSGLLEIYSQIMKAPGK